MTHKRRVELTWETFERESGGSQLKGCSSCGGCCGPVPVSPPERKKIIDFCNRNKIEIPPYDEKNKLLTTGKGMKCPFFSVLEKKCEIYPVRPLLCRMFGHIWSPAADKAGKTGSRTVAKAGAKKRKGLPTVVKVGKLSCPNGALPKNGRVLARDARRLHNQYMVEMKHGLKGDEGK